MLTLTVSSRARRYAAVAAALIPLAAITASARANTITITSSNWAGYAARSAGTHFKQVTASWVQPKASCTRGTITYSSFWTGLGGFNLNSSAMEQMGTELDCNSNGTQSVSAWYELVPAPPRTIPIKVATGDLITSTVQVVGNKVNLKLVDATRHETFTKTITDHSIDTTSAEWIAEAPSNCDSSGSCTPLPLANFGTATFANASATTSAGTTAPIVSSLWTTTKLLLGYAHIGTAFVTKRSTANATPSSLVHGNSAFLVVYSGQLTASPTG